MKYEIKSEYALKYYLFGLFCSVSGSLWIVLGKSYSFGMDGFTRFVLVFFTLSVMSACLNIPVVRRRYFDEIKEDLRDYL
jgi:hypothetical protein